MRNSATSASFLEKASETSLTRNRALQIRRRCAQGHLHPRWRTSSGRELPQGRGQAGGRRSQGGQRRASRKAIIHDFCIPPDTLVAGSLPTFGILNPCDSVIRLGLTLPSQPSLISSAQISIRCRTPSFLSASEKTLEAIPDFFVSIAGLATILDDLLTGIDFPESSTTLSGSRSLRRDRET